jgi:hypothetical protein
MCRVSDLRVGVAATDRDEHLAFAVGEPVDPRQRSAPSFGAGVAGDVRDQPPGDAW